VPELKGRVQHVSSRQELFIEACRRTVVLVWYEQRLLAALWLSGQFFTAAERDHSSSRPVQENRRESRAQSLTASQLTAVEPAGIGRRGAPRVVFSVAARPAADDGRGYAGFAASSQCNRDGDCPSRSHQLFTRPRSSGARRARTVRGGDNS